MSDIMRKIYKEKEYMDDFYEVFSMAAPINVSCVARGLSGYKKRLYAGDFMHPPFKNMWMEWEGPGLQMKNVAALIKTVKFEDGEDGGVVCRTTIIINNIIVAELTYGVFANGRLITRKQTRLRIPEIAKELEGNDDLPCLYVKPIMAEGVANYVMAVIYLSIEFLNASNVFCVPNNYPERISKYITSRTKKKKQYKYYTLEVKSKRLIDNSLQDLSLGHNTTRMHVVKGHYRDYRDRGLFGKLFVRIFIPSFVRGNLDYGAIIKDYKLNPRDIEEMLN